MAKRSEQLKHQKTPMLKRCSHKKRVKKLENVQEKGHLRG
jgi:hypothetical protein